MSSNSILSFLLKEMVNIFKFSHRHHIWIAVFVSYNGGRQGVAVKDLVQVSGGMDHQSQLSEWQIGVDWIVGVSSYM